MAFSSLIDIVSIAYSMLKHFSSMKRHYYSRFIALITLEHILSLTHSRYVSIKRMCGSAGLMTIPVEDDDDEGGDDEGDENYDMIVDDVDEDDDDGGGEESVCATCRRLDSD